MSTSSTARTHLSETSYDIEIVTGNGVIRGEPLLRCPRCGHNYLHHGQVTVFDRTEDATLTLVTAIVAGVTAVHLRPSSMVANPSRRRHGIAIAFECEECPGEIELTIAQHKGETRIAWRFEPLPAGHQWQPQ